VTADQHDLRLALEEALARLPASYRTAIRLCYLDGLTHQEAADRLRCPVGTVRSRLARGRARLREQLERWGLAPLAAVSSPARRSDADADAVPPMVAPHLIETTAWAAARLAAGQPLAETVPSRLVDIVVGVTRMMTMIKLATAAGLLAVAALAAWGVSAGLAAPQPPDPQPAPAQAGAAAPLLTVATAQAPAGAERIRGGRSREDQRPARTDPAILAELPPVVVDIEPKLGATDVDPALREIRVTFSKPMRDKSWSWTSGKMYATPRTNGEIHYENGRRTCVMPVKLEPGRTYVMGINSERFHGFQDADGRPALPYLLAFRTRASQ
jgi:RNA polymerase sigma-70 factor (ECF subfamily)